MVKNVGKNIGQEIAKREASRVTSRVVFSQKATASSLTSRFIPTRFRWIIPVLQEYFQQIRIPGWDKLRAKLPARFRKKELEGEVEELLTEAEVVPSISVAQKINQIYPQANLLTTLPPESQIKGIRGTYQIEQFLNNRGMGRLYLATRVPDGQPFVIKEYLLPEEYFNPPETKARKDAFQSLAGMDLVDNRLHDYRLITPVEAIADFNQPRCYLVTPSNIDVYPTLINHLYLRGAMTDREVHQLLNQVLQSLECLHSQKFRLPSGIVQQNISHGNLNLNSLLVAPNFQGFYTYLCDFSLWEDRFNPPLTQSPTYTQTQDLADLGYVAYQCLAWNLATPGKTLDPRFEKHWPPVRPEMKHFILRLMGVGAVPFDSAGAARKQLLRIPLDGPPPVAKFQDPIEQEEEKKQKKKLGRILLQLLGLTGGLLLFGFLLWLIFGRSKATVAASDEPQICCIENIKGVTPGDFVYTAEENSSWDYAFTTPNLILRDRTLKQEIEESQPKLDWLYRPTPSIPQVQAEIEKNLRDGEIDFVITSVTSSVNADLKAETIAYDGLVFFVAFSSAQRENSLPEALKGTITLEQLRQLYTGKVNTWKELDNRFPSLPVKLYIPLEKEARDIFEQRVLKDSQTIAKFRELIKSKKQRRAFASNPEIIPLQTFEMLRNVYGDFEKTATGSIGFAPISKVVGQCSVYPLALKDGSKIAISPLKKKDYQPVTPQTDLCDQKGSYAPNAEQIANREYPLAYSLAVIYPRDNSREPVGEKFADILKTKEAQGFLQKTGLVPLERENDK